MAFQRLTTTQRVRINRLRDRAWAAGLSEATFSQIVKDPEAWERDIAAAEATTETGTSDAA